MHRILDFTGEEHWGNVQPVPAQGYVCGYCGSDAGSSTGWSTQGNNCHIRLCPVCNAPTFFSLSRGSWPGPKPGANVSSLPDDVRAIYEEARTSIASNAYTGAVMLCRKILMHVAVERGAKENLSFQQYVEWLVNEHYVPQGADVWLDYIRQRGNDANHEIIVMTREDAIGVLKFTEFLVRGVHELPSLVPPAS